MQIRRDVLTPGRAVKIPIIYIVALCLAPLSASAVDVTVAWDANSETDLAGYILCYGTSSGSYTVDIDVGNNTQYTIKDLNEGTTYYFAAKAYDTSGAESTFSEELEYPVPASSNQKPIADAGSDQTVSEGTTVSLNGQNSLDPGGSIQSYSWRQIDGLTVQLFNSGSRKATFVAPDVGMAGDTLTFRLTVRDDGGLTDTDTCTIQVTKEAVVDSDEDGVPDDQDHFPLDPDEYLDTDGDGEGNSADTDDDNDGMPDEWELTYGLDPLRDDAAEDPDGDDMSNIEEYNFGTEPNFHQNNFKPFTPAPMIPQNESLVGLWPVLEADDFMDPDINDLHAQTQWVVFRVLDDVCVFDVTSDISLTSIIVPRQILEENTEYIWQVRYFDNHNTPSEWSETRTFATDFNVDDENGDGIRDDQEAADTIDLDEDGTPDIAQSDLKSIHIESRAAQIGISRRDDEKIQAITALESNEIGEIDAEARNYDQGMALPYGLISFRLLVSHPGDEVNLTLYLSEPALPNGIWYKYDPVNDVWYDYTAYTEFSDDRKRIYLTLKDGGFGDADGVANGIIIDPLALSVPSSPPPAAAENPVNNVSENSSSSGGGGGGSGCFVNASGQDLAADVSQAVRHRNLLAVMFILTIIIIGTAIRRLSPKRS